MTNIHTALTANGSSSTDGIKSLKVFYDTLIINLKSQQQEFVIVEKLEFDYETNEIYAPNNSILINYGDTQDQEANKTTGNGYIDTILLEKDKSLLICGLSALHPLSAETTVTFYGSAYLPIVHVYDINTHILTNITPDKTEWETFLMGKISKYHDVAVSFNTETNILNYLIKALKYVDAQPQYFWTDIEFKYQKNKLILNNVRALSSLATTDLAIISFRNYNDSEKLVVTANENELISFNI